MADYVASIGIDRGELKSGLRSAGADIDAAVRKAWGNAGSIVKGLKWGVPAGFAMAAKPIKDYGDLNRDVADQLARLERTSKRVWTSIGRDIAAGGVANQLNGLINKLDKLRQSAVDGLATFGKYVMGVLDATGGESTDAVTAALKAEEAAKKRAAYLIGGGLREFRAGSLDEDAVAKAAADKKREASLEALNEGSLANSPLEADRKLYEEISRQIDYIAEIERHRPAQARAVEEATAKRLEDEKKLDEVLRVQDETLKKQQHNLDARSRFLSNFRGERLDAAENRLGLIDPDTLDYAGRQKLEQDQRSLAVLRKEFSLTEKIKALEEDQLLTSDERLTQAAAWRSLTQERIDAINSQPSLGPRQFSGVFGGSLGLGHVGIGLESQVFGGGGVSSPLLATGRQQLKIAEDQLRELRKIADKAGAAGAQFQ